MNAMFSFLPISAAAADRLDDFSKPSHVPKDHVQGVINVWKAKLQDLLITPFHDVLCTLLSVFSPLSQGEQNGYIQANHRFDGESGNYAFVGIPSIKRPAALPAEERISLTHGILHVTVKIHLLLGQRPKCPKHAISLPGLSTQLMFVGNPPGSPYANNRSDRLHPSRPVDPLQMPANLQPNDDPNASCETAQDDCLDHLFSFGSPISPDKHSLLHDPAKHLSLPTFPTAVHGRAA